MKKKNGSAENFSLPRCLHILPWYKVQDYPHICTNHSIRKAIPLIYYDPLQLLLTLFLSTVAISLDPSTAHPLLLVSRDRKQVVLGKKQQVIPDNPQRFNYWAGVVSREGFTSGRHFWWRMVMPGDLVSPQHLQRGRKTSSGIPSMVTGLFCRITIILPLSLRPHSQCHT